MGILKTGLKLALHSAVDALELYSEFVYRAATRADIDRKVIRVHCSVMRVIGVYIPREAQVEIVGMGRVLSKGENTAVAAACRHVIDTGKVLEFNAAFKTAWDRYFDATEPALETAAH